jgi:hypothetical protein
MTRDQRAPSDFFRPYGRLPVRRRLLIALLAAVTALGIAWLLVYRPGGVHPPPARSNAVPVPQAADVERCAPGQTENCVGSTTRIITLP